MKKNKKIKNLKIGVGIITLAIASGITLSKTPINSKEVIVLNPESTIIKEWNENIIVEEYNWDIVNPNSIIKTSWISKENKNVPFESNISVLNNYKTEEITLKYNVFGECLNFDELNGREYLTKEDYEQKVNKTKKIKKQYPGLFS